jgi:glycosyltransferase involved in cell wall biosynthesis
MEVVVIAPVDEYISYKEKYPTVRHYGMRFMDRDSTNPFKDILLVMELIRRYRKIKPDIILHFTNKPNIFGSLAAKICGIPGIAVVTGLGYAFIHNGWIQKMITLLYKWTGRFNYKLIFFNADDRLLFINSGIVKAENAVAVKGSGVNLTDFSPSGQNNTPDKIIFTFIGRLLYDKGIREFVAAAGIVKQKLSGIQFRIVGELDEGNPATVNKDELITWVDDEIVQYHGFVKDVKQIIATSDCIVLPSYREGLPRTITEGMAMAKAVITTDTAGCREAVEDGVNGFLVPPGDSISLAQTMIKFYHLKPEEKLQMGKAGRIKAETDFDDRKIASDVFAVISSYFTEWKGR